MGFASYLEHIREVQEQLTTLAGVFRERLPAVESAGVDSGLLRAAIGRLEALAADIAALVELATDPTVDLGYKVRSLERENEALATRVRELEATVGTQEQDLRAKQSDILRLKRDLLDLTDAKSGKIYDEYVSPELISKLKPGR